MTPFFWLAAAMVLAACVLVIVPLTRKGEDSSAVSRAVARSAMVAVIVILPLAALNLYKGFSNWNWQPPVAEAAAPGQQDMQNMVAGLEQRLASEGGSVSDWHMLARSYLVMERVPEAIQAFERAYEMSGGGSADLKLDFADALMASDPASVTERAGQLIEDALKQEPTSRKALWYGGSVAFQRSDFAAAISRWQALLDGNPAPPEAMRNILEQNLASAQANLGGAPVAQSAPSASQDNREGASVSVNVALAPSLAAGISPSTPLFVIARVAGQQGGPPVAVQRRSAAELPLAITLSDADAMLPSRKLSGFDSVEIVARLSLGGGPVASAGDLYGTVNYNKGAEPTVSVLIDKVYP